MKTKIFKNFKTNLQSGIIHRLKNHRKFLPVLLCFMALLFSNGFSQRFSIEQTEDFLNEYWVSTPFVQISSLLFKDSLLGLVHTGATGFGITSDGGANWYKRTISASFARDAAVIMLSSDSLFYVSTNRKLIFSYDGGQNWTNAGDVNGIGSDIISMVFYDRLKGLSTTSDGKIYTSDNGGFSWTQVGGPFQDNRNTQVQVYDSLTICYGSNRSFLLSGDRGASWEERLFSDSINTPNFMKIINGNIFISATGNTWFRTDLNGNILFRETLPQNLRVENFAFPSDNEVWVAINNEGIKVSSPGSGVWTYSTYPQHAASTGIYESFNGNILVATSSVDEAPAMIKISNPGKKFSVKRGRIPGNYRLSAVKIVSPGLTIVGSYDGAIFRSTDQGRSWEKASGTSILPAITSITAKDQLNIFAGCTGGIILKSTDAGLSWTMVTTNITGQITAIEFKPVDTLFVTTSSKVYITTLSQIPVLTPVNLPTVLKDITKVKFWDGKSGYIGDSKSSYFTINGGKNWIHFSLGYLSTDDISILPGSGICYLSGENLLQVRDLKINTSYYSGFRGIFRFVDHDSTAGFILDTYYGAIMPYYLSGPRLEYFMAGGSITMNAYDYYNSSYSIGVGDGGSLIFISYKSNQEPPSACSGLTPDITSNISGKDVTLSWDETYLLTPNDEYQIELAREDTSSVINSQAGITTTSFIATGLEEEKTYYWRVRARNQFGWGEFTPWTKFFLARNIYTFREVQLPRNATINSITEAPGGTIWAAGDSGFVARSTTQGENWEVVPLPFSDDLKYCTANPFNGTLFFASTMGDIIVSTDNGNNWSRTISGQPGSVVRSVIFLSDFEGYLCGTNGLASRTSDGGVTWYLSSVPANVRDLNTILNLRDGVNLIAADGGVYLRADDFGRHYTSIPFLSGYNLRSLFRFNSKLHLFNEYASGLTSSDDGVTWQDLHLPFNSIVRQIDVSQGRYRILSENGGLYTSTLTGDGLNYQLLPGGSKNKAIYFSSTGNLFVAGAGNTLLIGKDTAVISGMPESGESAVSPGLFRLYQNYPNPFNGSTVIPLYLAHAGRTLIELFNPNGEKMAVILEEELSAGDHLISFDSRNLPSGIYFYRLTVANSSITRKMMLLK